MELKEKFSTEVERGDVIHQSPADGIKADYGSSVTLTVSLGPKHFPCPDFRGLSRDAAQALADRYGLSVDVLGSSRTTSGHDRLRTRRRGVGVTVTYGDPITLYLV